MKHSLERDRRAPLRSRRHHCFDHGIWGHATKRAPEGCTIDYFGLLADAHGPAFIIATKPEAQFLTCLTRPSRVRCYEAKYQFQQLERIRKQAAALQMQLIPLTRVVS
jgi:hypothetical protein